MRKILFRGKRKDNGEWVYGYLFDNDFENDKKIFVGHLVITEHKGVGDDVWNIDHAFYEVIPETVGQYTGLTDKNGKRIFEGDICRFREWSKGDMCWIGKVHYEHQQFVISGDKNKECESPFTLVMSRFIPENIEVIGNIHDTPELLKGGEE